MSRRSSQGSSQRSSYSKGRQRSTAMGFVDDVEDAEFEVTPDANVYSYFMFVNPTEAYREGGSFTMDTIMSYVLVFLNIFMQGLLLYVVFNKVVLANVDWKAGIMDLGNEGWNMFQSGHCNDGGSLCMLQNDTFTCAPPSVQLTGRWAELDADGDGVWTRSETVANQDRLTCKYAVDPVEVFDVFTRFLVARENLIWIHPDVRAGKAIHRPYFTYAMGDIAMCGYRHADMCPNLVQRGVFDAALRHGTAPRVGNTTESALHYCYELLRPGGTCETSLPSTYTTWKKAGTKQCGEPDYEKFVYTHPVTRKRRSMLAVEYDAVAKYERSQEPLFMTFKGIVLFLWALSMYVQLKDVTIMITWVLRFPRAEEFPNGPVEAHVMEEHTKLIIKGITTYQRVTTGILAMARLCIALVLMVVGFCFLLRATKYMPLLLDAVSLVFILEIGQILYEQALRPQIREQCEELEPMTVPMYGINWLNRRPAVVDLISLFTIIIFVFGLMKWYEYDTVLPLYDALQCTCLSQGDRCYEAETFSRSFWSGYWHHEVPRVFEDVAALRAGVTTPAPTSLLHVRSGVAARLHRHIAAVGRLAP